MKTFDSSFTNIKRQEAIDSFTELVQALEERNKSLMQKIKDLETQNEKLANDYWCLKDELSKLLERFLER